MIARRLPEYGYIVTNNSYIQRSLHTDCVTIQHPVGCFEQAMLTPLRRLKNEPKENWYIVIDALDECLSQSETSHSIVYMINNKLLRFPSWLKLVMTSRNESSVSLKSKSVMKLIIDPEDTRNIDDIELYLSMANINEHDRVNWNRVIQFSLRNNCLFLEKSVANLEERPSYAKKRKSLDFTSSEDGISVTDYSQTRIKCPLNTVCPLDTGCDT